MCGIFIAHSRRGPLPLDRCHGALQKLELRGPDFTFSNEFPESGTFLGQTILSITGDPSNAIGRYHVSRSGNFTLAFNGEIYNHVELSRRSLEPHGFKNASMTDTEVLVNLHDHLEPSAIHSELSGMYTYVVHDAAQQRLIIARDLIGEKILYRYEDDDLLVLSSEIAPILEMVPHANLNVDALREYFFTRHFLAPEKTAYEGIDLVPPGSLSTFDLGNGSWRQHMRRQLSDLIDPNRLERYKRSSDAELLEEAIGVFAESARMIAPPDVDFSAIFSGGMDSSLSSAFLKREKSPANFLGLGFPGKDDVAAHLDAFEKPLGAQIRRENVTWEAFQEKLASSYSAVGGPLPTHSYVSQSILSEIIRNAGIKVLVGGDGGDELFGGYEAYKSLPISSTFPADNPSPYSGVVDIGFQFGDWNSDDLRSKLHDNWASTATLYQHESDPQDRMIQSVLYSDTVIQLESAGIRSSDVMSMMHSVEPRCFFLTQPMMALAVNLPASAKLDMAATDPLMVTRPLVKQIFIREFGKELLFPKQGFSGFPNEAGRALVNGDFSRTRSFLDLTAAPSFEGEAGHAAEWKLINVELFLRHDETRRINP